MKTVNEVMKLAGISVRTLHYYDEIGLLKPSSITDAGYRLYDVAELERLQQILFFRELDFPLKEISELMSNPSYDKSKVLQNHRKLLTLKRDRMNALIDLVDNTMKGDKNMSFEEFDMSQIEEAKKQYGAEAEERWGNTDAFKESKKKTEGYSKEQWSATMEESNLIFKSFAENRANDASSPEVQQLVADWKAFITKSYYNCTNEILAGLGEMYVADERFTANIDKFGDGTAKFMSDAIKIYCR